MGVVTAIVALVIVFCLTRFDPLNRGMGVVTTEAQVAADLCRRGFDPLNRGMGVVTYAKASYVTVDAGQVSIPSIGEWGL